MITIENNDKENENLENLENTETIETVEQENIEENINIQEETKVSEKQVTEEHEVLFDTSSYIKEYETYGKLSDESYEKIEKAGISRDIVDLYIDGQKAIIELHSQNLMKIVGGADEYKKMVSWAAENLTESEKNAFNNAVDNSDFATATFAISGLNARYKNATNFNSGSRIEADNGQYFDVYSSMAEMVKDVKDERYKSDEAFRLKVMQKAMRSSL